MLELEVQMIDFNSSYNSTRRVLTGQIEFGLRRRTLRAFKRWWGHRWTGRHWLRRASSEPTPPVLGIVRGWPVLAISPALATKGQRAVAFTEPSPSGWVAANQREDQGGANIHTDDHHANSWRRLTVLHDVW